MSGAAKRLPTGASVRLMAVGEARSEGAEWEALRLGPVVDDRTGETMLVIDDAMLDAFVEAINGAVESGSDIPIDWSHGSERGGDEMYPTLGVVTGARRDGDRVLVAKRLNVRGASYIAGDQGQDGQGVSLRVSPTIHFRPLYHPSEPGRELAPLTVSSIAVTDRPRQNGLAAISLSRDGVTALLGCYAPCGEMMVGRDTVLAGETVWLYIGIDLPADVAALFPADLEDPPHVTALYALVPADRAADAFAVAVREVDALSVPVEFDLCWLDHFDIGDDGRVAVCGVGESEHIYSLRGSLLGALERRRIPYALTHGGSFMPHATIAYLPAGASWDGPVPRGEVEANVVTVSVKGGETYTRTIPTDRAAAAAVVEMSRPTGASAGGATVANQPQATETTPEAPAPAPDKVEMARPSDGDVALLAKERDAAKAEAERLTAELAKVKAEAGSLDRTVATLSKQVEVLTADAEARKAADRERQFAEAWDVALSKGGVVAGSRDAWHADFTAAPDVTLACLSRVVPGAAGVQPGKVAGSPGPAADAEVVEVNRDAAGKELAQRVVALAKETNTPRRDVLNLLRAGRIGDDNDKALARAVYSEVA